MGVDLKRRALMAWLGGAAAGLWCGSAFGRLEELAADRIAAAWRGRQPEDPYHCGVLRADWRRRRLLVEWSVRLPTRPHGLLRETNGNLLVAGVRPGHWLWRIGRDGEVLARVDLRDEPGAARLGGHALVLGDHVLTAETDYQTGRGVIGVRDGRTLKKLDQWQSGGIEPHQLLADREGHLMVANGGIHRTPEDKKIDLPRMASSLTRLDHRNGRVLEQWQLDDRRLSLRHLAWNVDPADGAPLLGVAMQSEHDSAADRARAPVLAVLADGELSPVAGNGSGYAGDIAPASRGGFVLSSNSRGLVSWWHPAQADQMQPVVEMQEAYALANWRRDGALVATAPGLIRWHPAEPPAFLAWPEPMALDNHWIWLEST